MTYGSALKSFFAIGFDLEYIVPNLEARINNTIIFNALRMVLIEKWEVVRVHEND